VSEGAVGESERKGKREKEYLDGGGVVGPVQTVARGEQRAVQVDGVVCVAQAAQHLGQRVLYTQP